MGSLIEELRRREAAARAEADRLRSRIEELSEDLSREHARAFCRQQQNILWSSKIRFRP
jgi:hypothetical protein